MTHTLSSEEIYFLQKLKKDLTSLKLELLSEGLSHKDIKKVFLRKVFLLSKEESEEVTEEAMARKISDNGSEETKSETTSNDESSLSSLSKEQEECIDEKVNSVDNENALDLQEMLVKKLEINAEKLQLKDILFKMIENCSVVRQDWKLYLETEQESLSESQSEELQAKPKKYSVRYQADYYSNGRKSSEEEMTFELLNKKDRIASKHSPQTHYISKASKYHGRTNYTKNSRDRERENERYYYGAASKPFRTPEKTQRYTISNNDSRIRGTGPSSPWSDIYSTLRYERKTKPSSIYELPALTKASEITSTNQDRRQKMFDELVESNSGSGSVQRTEISEPLHNGSTVMTSMQTSYQQSNTASASSSFHHRDSEIESSLASIQRFEQSLQESIKKTKMLKLLLEKQLLQDLRQEEEDDEEDEEGRNLDREFEMF